MPARDQSRDATEAGLLMRPTVLPTPKAVLLALAAAGSAWAGAMLGVFALFAFSVGIATLLVLGFLSVFTGGRKSWNIERVLLPATPQVGESVFVEIIAVPNRAFAPTLTLFEPTPWGTRGLGLSATYAQKDPLRISWQVATTARGVLHAGPGVIVRHDLFSLFRRRFADLATSELLVLPQVTRFEPERLLELLGVQATGLSEDAEPGDMRAYVPGDDPRRVNWKASARTMSSGTLIVADVRPRGGQAEIRVQLDVESLPPTDWDVKLPEGIRETAVSVAASIVNELANQERDHLGRSETHCVLEIIAGSRVVHRSDNAHQNAAALAVLESLESLESLEHSLELNRDCGHSTETASNAGTILITGPQSVRTGRVTLRCGRTVPQIARHDGSGLDRRDGASARSGVYEIEALPDLARLLATK